MLTIALYYLIITLPTRDSIVAIPIQSEEACVKAKSNFSKAYCINTKTGEEKE